MTGVKNLLDSAMMGTKTLSKNLQTHQILDLLGLLGLAYPSAHELVSQNPMNENLKRTIELGGLGTLAGSVIQSASHAPTIEKELAKAIVTRGHL